MPRKLYGPLGLFCVLWFATCVVLAARVPEQEQLPRLAWMGLGLLFAAAARVAFGRAMAKKP